MQEQLYSQEERGYEHARSLPAGGLAVYSRHCLQSFWGTRLLLMSHLAVAARQGEASLEQGGRVVRERQASVVAARECMYVSEWQAVGAVTGSDTRSDALLELETFRLSTSQGRSQHHGHVKLWDVERTAQHSEGLDWDTLLVSYSKHCRLPYH